MSRQSAVLVIGSNGFLGARTVAALLRRGRRVVGLDLSAPSPAILADAAAQYPGSYSVGIGDVRDGAVLASLIDTEDVAFVVNSAAILGDGMVSKDLARAFEVNGMAVWQLCAIAERRPQVRRVVHISTRSVYGDYGPDEGPLDEETPPRNAGPYGTTKTIGDLAVQTYRLTRGLDVVAARVTGLFGPGSPRRNLLLSMCEAVRQREQFTLATGADYTREYTHVDDVAEALLTLLDANRITHPFYNVGAGRQFSLAEVAIAVRATYPDAKIDIGGGLPGGEECRATLAVARIVGEFGWTPRPLQAGIQSVLESPGVPGDRATGTQQEGTREKGD
jgi:nucleoside-diphosphate-sugar epimerase